MDERLRRRSLTPLSGELRAADPWNARTPRRGRLASLRARRRRRPPATLAGAVARGLLRLGVAVAIASAVGVGIATLIDRDVASGLYIAGAGLLAVAFFSSAADMESPFYDGYDRQEREYRVNASFLYAAAGFAVVGLGVLAEVLG
jgi:hypothetical protein